MDAFRRLYSVDRFTAPTTTKEDEYIELSQKTAKPKEVVTIEKPIDKPEEVTFESNPEGKTNVAEPEVKIADTEESIPKLIAGLEVLLLTLDEADKVEISNLIEGLKLLL
jgi:hypothetical protein